jgi:hypothetical protein
MGTQRERCLPARACTHRQPPRKTVKGRAGSQLKPLTPVVIPGFRFPRIVESARRRSTREVLRMALRALARMDARTGPLSSSFLARLTGYHPRTVARALLYAERTGVIRCVSAGARIGLSATRRPGIPNVYTTKWKARCAIRAPSPTPPTVYRHEPSTTDRLRPSLAARRWAIARCRDAAHDAHNLAAVEPLAIFCLRQDTTRQELELVAAKARSLIPAEDPEDDSRAVFAQVRYKLNALVGEKRKTRQTANADSYVIPENDVMRIPSETAPPDGRNAGRRQAATPSGGTHESRSPGCVTARTATRDLAPPAPSHHRHPATPPCTGLREADRAPASLRSPGCGQCRPQDAGAGAVRSSDFGPRSRRPLGVCSMADLRGSSPPARPLVGAGWGLAAQRSLPIATLDRTPHVPTSRPLAGPRT